MKCQRCQKNRSQTFRREGGLAENPKTGEKGDIRKWDAVCLPCIKKWMKEGHKFWEGPIISNPTIMPSGEPTEWVINE